MKKQNVAVDGLLLGVVRTEATKKILETKGDVQIQLDPNNLFLSVRKCVFTLSIIQS